MHMTSEKVKGEAGNGGPKERRKKPQNSDGEA